MSSTTMKESGYREILDAIPDTISRYDRNLRRTYVNRAPQAFTGTDPAETVGMSASALFVHAQEAGLRFDTAVADEWLGILRGVFESGETVDYEGQFFGADGTVYFYMTRLVPEFGPDGQVYSVLAVSRDISNKVRADDEAKLMATLARRNEELEQVIYAVSHDLQEPLRTISSYLEIFRTDFEGKIGAEADEYIEFVSQASSRLRSQVRGLLEFSRVESKGQEPEVINLADLVMGVALDLNIGRYVQVDSLPEVWADLSQLRRVIQNLLGNSKKYRRHDVPLHIRVFPVGPTNGHHTIGIEDNGMGIEAEYQERIFHIFYRLHAHHMIPGTGLGLALAKRVITRHQGKIWVESVLGEGSTFYFTLPRLMPSGRIPMQTDSDPLG